MNIFYYYDHSCQVCPVKQYLGKFLKEDKLLAILNSKIVHIAQKRNPSPPLAKTLIGYPFFEIIQPFKDFNIRILCAFIEDDLIVFHGFDKPKYYNNVKKINKDIKNNYDITKNYYYNFLESIKKEKHENFKEEFK